MIFTWQKQEADTWQKQEADVNSPSHKRREPEAKEPRPLMSSSGTKSLAQRRGALIVALALELASDNQYTTIKKIKCVLLR